MHIVSICNTKPVKIRYLYLWNLESKIKLIINIRTKTKTKHNITKIMNWTCEVRCFEHHFWRPCSILSLSCHTSLKVLLFASCKCYVPLRDRMLRNIDISKLPGEWLLRERYGYADIVIVIVLVVVNVVIVFFSHRDFCSISDSEH